MAGRIPELKDLEAALQECADVESAQNAFHEYRKRGGLNDGDNAGAALRKRVTAIRGPKLAERMEHYSKDGLTIDTGKGEGGVALSDEQPPQVGSAVMSAIHPSSAPLAPQSSVLPAVTPTEARAADNAYLEMVRGIEGPGDTVDIKGKPFRTKQFWRKMARHYRLTDEIGHEETIINNATGQLLGFKLRVTVTAPNGRQAVGVGMATLREKKDATDHQLYALAHTRAKNRAISDLVAAGEPSAEEVE